MIFGNEINIMFLSFSCCMCAFIIILWKITQMVSREFHERKTLFFWEASISEERPMFGFEFEVYGKFGCLGWLHRHHAGILIYFLCFEVNKCTVSYVCSMCWACLLSHMYLPSPHSLMSRENCAHKFTADSKLRVGLEELPAYIREEMRSSQRLHWPWKCDCFFVPYYYQKTP